MLRRAVHRSSELSATAALTLQAQQRSMHYPGWQTQMSTKKDRSREVRDLERKQRQLEKLPQTQILPDFPYIDEKVVLSDSMMQPTLYSDELDTPHLFNLSDGSDFFLYWNVSDFERSSYPPVPEVDHRQHPSASPEFQAHSKLALQYLAKHQVTPHFVPHTANAVNLSVVFGEEPEKAQHLTEKNFWHTSHCGNYIELKELQDMPSIYLNGASSPEAADDYYTLVIASPDYPFRTSPNRGFYVSTVVANLKAGADGAMKPCKGDVVVPYTPPLPHEDAGTARVLCMLFRQNGGKRIADLRMPTEEQEAEAFPFSLRSNYRLHAGQITGDGAKMMSGLLAVEAGMTECKGHAISTTFFQTNWDIQVQEFYEKIDVLEPNYIPEDLETLLQYNARPVDAERVKSRRLEDGSRNSFRMEKFRAPYAAVMTQHRLPREEDLQKLNFSRRTLLSKDGKPIIRPNYTRY